MTMGLLALALSLSSCAVTAKFPMTRFETPEATGTGERVFAEGLLGYQGRNEVEFTPDYNLRAPTVTNPSVEKPSHRLMGQGYVGLLDWFDIGLTLPNSRLGLKAQLIGEPRLRAEQGNFSAALNGGIAYSREEASSRAFSNTTQAFKLTEWQMDAGLALGYRFSKNVLLYTGPFILWDFVKINYQQNTALTGTELNGTIRSVGFNLGTHITLDRVFFRMEGAGTKTKIGNVNIGQALTV
ncbi:MAG: hypothetical protein M9962_01100 [Oligoflexia bacterium]|nr:hypothetical protein [Oligoflexia bacterium]